MLDLDWGEHEHVLEGTSEGARMVGRSIPVPEQELRRELERVVRQRDRAVEVLREIKDRDPNDLGYVQHVQLAAHSALAEIEESG